MVHTEVEAEEETALRPLLELEPEVLALLTVVPVVVVVAEAGLHLLHRERLLKQWWFLKARAATGTT